MRSILRRWARLLRGRRITLLKEGPAPVSLLEITEIKGFGAKTVQRLYRELGVTDLASLQARVDDGSVAKLKGFGAAKVAAIGAHAAALEKKKIKAAG